MFVQAFHKAGVPKGVINIVSGRGSEIGDYLTVGGIQGSRHLGF